MYFIDFKRIILLCLLTFIFMILNGCYTKMGKKDDSNEISKPHVDISINKQINTSSVDSIKIDDKEIENFKFYYCIVNTANIREQPTTKSEIIGKLYLNEKIKVFKIQKDWCKVKFGDKEGWIYSKLLDNPSIYYIISSPCHMREFPNPSSKSIMELNLNTKVEFVYKIYDWIRIEYKGVKGWVHKIQIGKREIENTQMITSSDFIIYDKKIKPPYTGLTGIKFKSQAILSVLVPKNIKNEKVILIGDYICQKVYPSIEEIGIFFYKDTPAGRRMAKDEFYEPSNNEVKDFVASYIKNPEWNNGKPIIDFEL